MTRPLRRRVLVVLAGVLLLGAAGYLARHAVLRGLGAALIAPDRVGSAEIAVMTTEVQLDGELELADLWAAHVVPEVGVLLPDRTRAEREMAARGVVLDDAPARLTRLGVPAAAIVTIDANEGGTVDATAALAAWCRTHRIHTLLVVTSVSHSRRVERSLARDFGRDGPTVLVHVPRLDGFRADTWWQHRGTLRVGLVELEKLALDYLRHPLG
jgi:uncharacterized SAM-binding protein YcdF (DUF218 family)